MLNKTNMLQTKKQNTQNKQCTTTHVQIHKTNNVQHTCTKYTKQTMYNNSCTKCTKQTKYNNTCTKYPKQTMYNTHVQNKAITKLVFRTNV